MLPENCEQIEIDNVFYPCGKVKRTVLITYRVTTAPSRDPAECGVPEVTPFDCSQKYTCGVCIPEGQRQDILGFPPRSFRRSRWNQFAR